MFICSRVLVTNRLTVRCYTQFLFLQLFCHLVRLSRGLVSDTFSTVFSSHSFPFPHCLRLSSLSFNLSCRESGLKETSVFFLNLICRTQIVVINIIYRRWFKQLSWAIYTIFFIVSAADLESYYHYLKIKAISLIIFSFSIDFNNSLHFTTFKVITIFATT